MLLLLGVMICPGLVLAGVACLGIATWMTIEATGPITCNGEVMPRDGGYQCIGGGHFDSYEAMEKHRREDLATVPYVYAIGAAALLVGIPTTVVAFREMKRIESAGLG